MHAMNTAEPFNKLISCKCRAFISCLFGPLYIRKDLIIQKGGGGPFWSPRREALALIVDIVLTVSLKGGSSLSELFYGGGGWWRGLRDKRSAPLSLCKRSHRSGGRSKSNNHLCFPHTLWCSYLGLALRAHLCTHNTSVIPICAHVDCMMKDDLSKMGESTHICFPSCDMFVGVSLFLLHTTRASGVSQGE